ncbi:hypothetical protein M2140_002166 [Clostridiales Family XIII bacterium PM5-7]
MGRAIKIGLGIILLFLIINGTILLISEHSNKNMPINAENSMGNPNELNQDNCVIYSESNGLMTAPFIFGSRLYVYSIDEDKDYLVSNLKRPFHDWGRNFCFKGNRIVASGGFDTGDGAATEWLITLDGEKRELQLDTYHCQVLGNDDIFAIDHFGKTISRIDLTTEEREMLVTRSDYSFEQINIINNHLIAEDNNCNELIVIDLLSKEENTFKLDNTSVTAVTEFGENKFIAICSQPGDILEFDLQKNTMKKIAVIDSKEKGKGANFSENCKVIEHTLYCNDFEYNIIKINLRTGEISNLIDVSLVGEDIVTMRAYYCTDYIAIESYLGENYKKQLQIFDYEGKLLKTKKIRNK